MDVRYSVPPEYAKTFDTDKLRDQFLVQGLFRPDQVSVTYALDDRMLIVGVCPAKKTLTIDVGPEIHGAGFLLERREMGVINLGGAGTITADGKKFTIAKYEGIYLGKGTKDIHFASASAGDPARFYSLSGPAHAEYPTTPFTFNDANHVDLGSDEEANRRTIHQYIHQNGVKSCNLVMGYTSLEKGSVWNTMPSHTHLRRMEVYCYFDIPQGARVFHMMGEPTETRHVLMDDGDAIISPAWSIHAGVGTREYCFVWAMLGENQRFDDMDKLTMGDMR